tara:strand:+ start:736 stop:849 length:114 start_codon:yes stop_codon:yes gene_type:complete
MAIGLRDVSLCLQGHYSVLPAGAGAGAGLEQGKRAGK